MTHTTINNDPRSAHPLRAYGLRSLAGVGLLLAIAPGCGSNCLDDGFAWNQKQEECVAASATETTTTTSESDSVSVSVSETDTTGAMTDTEGSGSMSMSATETDTGGPGLWCKDADMDGQGDPDDCIPADGDIPPGYVPNDQDCNDDDPKTFVGAAELEDPDACMTDSDDDGWGSEDPSPGAVPGTDCDDGNIFAFPGSAELDDPDACMEDKDGDGWGEDEPGDGIIPGNDCVDTDEHTYPGAAELDNPLACTKDEDDDGWADMNPPPGAVPGLDCDDTSEHTFPGAAPLDDPLACMKDEDGDDWGDNDPLVDGVIPGSDCDDASDTTFPGSAPLDDPLACMKDDDDDDRGDDNPQTPGVTPGTDCNDSDVNIFENCADCEPDEKFCVEDDLYLCNMMGTGAQIEEECEFGCDMDNGVCFEELTVDAGESICIDQGAMAQLQGTAMGGDGVYMWDWTPADSLDDANIDNPVATPGGATTYQVTVTDGLNSMATDNVSIFLKNTPLALSDEECAITNFAWGGNSNANWNWDPNLVELCETVNSTPTARFCGWSLDNANLRGRFEIKTASDDDYVGFLWGIQPFDQEVEEPTQFYYMSWKQGAQLGVFCPGFPLSGAAGIQVHRINVKDPINAPLSCEDFHNPLDTENSTVLANEAEFTTQGWLDNVAYIFDLTHTPTGFTVKIIREDNDQVIAEKEFVDDTYPNGQVGFYAYSQQNACFSNFQTDCL